MKAGFPLALALVLGLGAAPASAQIEPGAPGSKETIPEKDRSRPEDRPKGETPRPQEDGVTTGRSLSEQLDESGGVIKPPPSRDPEMVKPAPDVGTTPVIPPPGMPGGPPGPEPK